MHQEERVRERIVAEKMEGQSLYEESKQRLIDMTRTSKDFESLNATVNRCLVNEGLRIMIICHGCRVFLICRFRHRSFEASRRLANTGACIDMTQRKCVERGSIR